MEWWEVVGMGRTEEEVWEDLREEYPEGGVVRLLGPVPRNGEPVKVFQLWVPPMTYQEYLNSSTWRSIRAAALRGAEHRCQVCDWSDDLEVHHRRYPARGTERWPNDLTVLCSLCHTIYEKVNQAVSRRIRWRQSRN